MLVTHQFFFVLFIVKWGVRLSQLEKLSAVLIMRFSLALQQLVGFHEVGHSMAVDVVGCCLFVAALDDGLYDFACRLLG